MNILNSSYEPAVRIDSLTAHPENPRRGNIEAVAESIDANGFYGAVIAQVSTRRILENQERATCAGKPLGFSAGVGARSGRKFDGLEIPKALLFIAFQQRPGMEIGKRHFRRLKVFWNVERLPVCKPELRCRP